MAISRPRGRPGPAAAPPASDVYTGLLGISLAAMVVGCIFLYLDRSQYPEKKPDTAPSPSAIKSAAPGK